MLYLGAPGRVQDCPAGLVGATEAMLLQPSARRAVPRAVDYPVDRMITVVTRRITVTASYSSDRAQIGRMLASAALPMPARGSDGGATPPGMTGLRPAGIRAAVPQALPAAATSYTGPGFDACTAPGAAQMLAWRQQSPYRAVGIYIGGSDRACAPARPDRVLVRQQQAAGWHFMPIYVGPQESFGEITAAARQGPARPRTRSAGPRLAGAAPAAHGPAGQQAGRGGPGRRRDRRVLARVGGPSPVAGPVQPGPRLGQGTRPGRAARFRAGPAASGRGTLTVFWQGRDGHLWVIRRQPGHSWSRPASLGMGRLGGAPAATGLASGEVDVFWPAKSHASVWQLSYLPGHGWGTAHNLPAGVSAGPVAVAAPATGVDVFWKGSNGTLWWTAGHGASWAQPASAGMGVLGSAPFAAGQPGGVANVFWKGSADGHLWQARYRRGAWSGPADLGGAVRLGVRRTVYTADAEGLLRRGRDQGHLQGSVRYT